MGRTSRAALGGMALALGMIAQPASATSTAGWSQADRSAATIREFQTRLMVAALRCRAAGIDVLASYNQFIAADRAEIMAANDRLKAHFRSASPATGERDYDRYTTSLANGFAGEQWSPRSCDNAARLAREAAQSRGSLLAIAARQSNVTDSDAAPYHPAPRAYDDRSAWAAYDRDAQARRYNDDWRSPQAQDDRAPPPGYDERGSPPRYSDDWRANEADEDHGPPPGYYDRSPSWRDRDDGRSQQAHYDRAPSRGYDDRAPPSGYDDRGPPPGDDGH